MIWLILGIISFGVALLLYMWKEAHGNKVKEETIVLNSYPGKEPFTFFFISDIHRRKIHPSIIEAIKGRAELIIIGGDLAEKRVSFERIAYNLQLLREVAPVFFVWGNNDYELPKQSFEQLLKAHDVVMLRNESFCVQTVEGKEIYLLGVDDLSVGYSDKESTFKQVPDESFKILLSHNPLFIRRMMEKDQVALFLSGHTHGGQIRLLGMGLYKQGGWTQRGNMMVLVSNGYGTSALPLRLGAKAETHLITIMSS
ncbi:metallophosphoesterase [Bacillus sp. REN10]|uniref:metallophosphoesterase n=1 Tax=Bacillus sp. REN10 TaxID=2782541 RepID=UPI00193B2DBD|nr:metallophosphoesterase [Bacillus sp. REN10]